MPVLSNIANATAKAYGFTSLGGFNYMAFYNATTNIGINDAKLSSNNSLYVAGTSGSTTSVPMLLCITPSGSLFFQKTYGTVYSSFSRFVFDSSDNLILPCSDQPNPTNGVFKINNAGSILTTTGLSGSTTANAYNTQILYDPSGNLVVLGTVPVSTYGTVQISKYDSSLSLLSQYKYSVSATTIGANNFCIDSSGNMYFVSRYYLAPYQYFTILKTDSSGTVLWSNRYRFTDGTTDPCGITCDSSGNIYVAGIYQANYSISFLTKLDSSGTKLWTKTLSKTNTYVWTDHLTIDSDSNYIYTSGYYGDYTNNSLMINKYDLSGNLIWQKSISTASTTWNTGGLNISKDNYYLSATPYTSSTQKGFFACLPNDGSKNGTYALNGSNYVYANNTLTDSTNATYPIASTHTTPTKTTTTYATASATKTPSNLTYTLSTKPIQ